MAKGKMLDKNLTTPTFVDGIMHHLRTCSPCLAKCVQAASAMAAASGGAVRGRLAHRKRQGIHTGIYRDFLNCYTVTVTVFCCYSYWLLWLLLLLLLLLLSKFIISFYSIAPFEPNSVPKPFQCCCQSTAHQLK